MAEPGAYQRLCTLFRDADDRYNSGLFHFLKERGRATPEDSLTPSIKIDDAPLQEIINRLYYPCPYEFGMIPIQIMGKVYEQFIGQVIVIGEDGRVTVEEKPEVRKAGGVFYTPEYIADYIVSTILSALLNGRKPKEVSDMHLLDAACGSGSFLVSAYRYLLRWHREQYIMAGPHKHKKELYEDVFGDWQLYRRRA